MTIASKKEMYAIYERGGFGNRLLTWPNVDAYLQSDYSGLVVLRYKGAGGGAWCEYGVHRDDVEATVSRWISEGARRDLVTVNELAEDDLIILQGEVMQSPHHLSLRYSRLPMPMRKALAKEQYHVDGLSAALLLKSTMDPSSWDELNDLLDMYSGAVVEFSVWGKDIGDAPRRNTVFWEVRHY